MKLKLVIVLDCVLGYPRIILELFSVLFFKENLCDLEQPNYKKANRGILFFFLFVGEFFPST